MEWISMIITAIASGGLAGFGSLWYARRKSKAEVAQAESEAAKSWQDVYQELIEDLRTSRNEQEEQNDKLRSKVNELEERIIKLRKEVENTAKELAWLIPITCCVKDCKDRIVFTEGKGFVNKRKCTKKIKENEDKQSTAPESSSQCI